MCIYFWSERVARRRWESRRRIQIGIGKVESRRSDASNDGRTHGRPGLVAFAAAIERSDPPRKRARAAIAV